MDRLVAGGLDPVVLHQGGVAALEELIALRQPQAHAFAQRPDGA